jgi:hypothetical protein
MFGVLDSGIDFKIPVVWREVVFKQDSGVRLWIGMYQYLGCDSCRRDGGYRIGVPDTHFQFTPGRHGVVIDGIDLP